MRVIVSLLVCFVFTTQFAFGKATSIHPHDSLETAQYRVVFTGAEYEELDLAQANDERMLPMCDSSAVYKDLFESIHTPMSGGDTVQLDILISDIADSINLFIEIYVDTGQYLSCFEVGQVERLLSLQLPADSSMFYFRYYTDSPDSIPVRTFKTSYVSRDGIQRCPPNLTAVRDQNFIDSFSYNYPFCQEYHGNLIIQDEAGSTIENLHGLRDIVSIDGNLEIGYCQNLTDLKGLENLRSIDKTLSISWTNLTSIEALSSLERVKSFMMFGNLQLVDSVNLASLTEVTGRVTVNNNPYLKDLRMFSNVQSIGQSVLISWNQGLESLDGLDQLEVVEGDLTIEYNGPTLSNIDGLGQLRRVGNHFTFSQIDHITDLSALSSLSEVEGNFFISECGDLEFLTGLESLVHLGNNFSIVDNDRLFQLTGLDNLRTIDGFLRIEGNASLGDLDALSNLEEINNFLNISGNSSLVSITGLSQLDPYSIESSTPIHKDLTLVENSALSICNVEPICSFLDIPGVTYRFRDNDNRCSNVQMIKDDCVNPILPVELIDFTATKEEDKVRLDWETAEEVNNLGYTLQRSADGIDWVDLGFVYGNGTITAPTAYRFYDENPETGWNYYQLIQEDYDGNKEILGLQKVEFIGKLEKAFPNPVQDVLYISSSSVDYQLFNASGLLSLEGNGQSISMRDLRPGIYFLSIRNEVQKIIKY